MAARRGMIEGGRDADLATVVGGRIVHGEGAA
jgi:hypothetical protein